MTAEPVSAGVVRIGREEYADFTALQHLFLVGDLRKPNPHPFVRDARLELILCFYEPGDDGRFHWHPEVTEYEVILEGEVGYVEPATGLTSWFSAGDCCVIAPGTCVKRLVPAGARTVTIKVPSADDKVHCSGCPRACGSRVEAFRGE